MMEGGIQHALLLLLTVLVAQSVAQVDTTVIIGAAVGGGGGLVVLLLIIIVFVCCCCCCCKRRRKHGNRLNSSQPSSPSHIPMVQINERAFDPIEEFRRSSSEQSVWDHPAVHRDEFINRLMVLKMNDHYALAEEFGTIPSTLPYASDICVLPENVDKNRFDNILPYDHTRVKLCEGSDDYINANYLDGYQKSKMYIATQGPKSSTIKDFWRMVWNENSRTIVMVTRTKEKSTIKCEVYWPTDKATPLTCGDIEITLVEDIPLVDFTMRTFTVVKKPNSETRDIRQFHFTSWPDMGVPQFPTAMLAMVRCVRAFHNRQTNSGPMVVHCSAGVGRTGTFIVIDGMLLRLKDNNPFMDIYGYVSLLRHQRGNMVQTEDQYYFIHEAIGEAITCGTTELNIEEFPVYVDKLDEMDGGESVLELEFQRLATDRTESHRFASATLDVNKNKNRFVNILPYEYNRVKLSFITATSGSDYINASYIDSYRQQRAFIATQAPRSDTVDDFWRMIWEQRVPIIVMLTQFIEKQQECSAQFWSDTSEEKYGKIQVKVSSSRKGMEFVYREFILTHDEDPNPHTTKLFHFFGWPERGGVPTSAISLISLVHEVQKLYITLKSVKPITVMCSSGVGRTGVYITISIIFERLLIEGVIDVFQTVKMLRIQRSAMVQTLEQYHFIYYAMLDYLINSGQLKAARSLSFNKRASVLATSSQVHISPSDTNGTQQATPS